MEFGMKNVSRIVTGLLVLLLSCATFSQNIITISPTNPTVGQPVTVTFSSIYACRLSQPTPAVDGSYFSLYDVRPACPTTAQPQAVGSVVLQAAAVNVQTIRWTSRENVLNSPIFDVQLQFSASPVAAVATPASVPTLSLSGLIALGLLVCCFSFSVTRAVGP